MTRVGSTEIEVRVETPKQLAERVNVSERQIRKLIRNGELDSIQIGARIYVPCDAWGHFVQRSRSRRWHDGTKAQNYDILKIEEPITSPGQSAVAAASARLAQQIASKLKSPSANGSRADASQLAQVIPLKPS